MRHGVIPQVVAACISLRQVFTRPVVRDDADLSAQTRQSLQLPSAASKLSPVLRRSFLHISLCPFKRRFGVSGDDPR